MRYEWIVAFFISLPVFAQDWGRYAGGYIAPPVLAEIQLRGYLADARNLPTYVNHTRKHPNSLPVDTRGVGQTPPRVGVQ